MTRYSRSVIPGRSQGEGGDKAALDQMVFGNGKKKPVNAPARDEDDPDFLPAVEDDEADLLVGRSNSERRKGEDRRKPGADRRAGSRRSSEYAPLREQGAYRGGDDSRRGPILLVGAVMIVAVFGVVVWNAYREDGATTEVAETEVLAGAGPFKRPFIDQPGATTPSVAEQAEVLDALDGAPASGSVASSEQRPATPPPAAAPNPRNPTAAPSPAPLKTPQQSDPVRAATAVTQPGPVALTPAPATPQAATPKPAVPQAVAPKPVAAAPAPAPSAVVSAPAAKPAFSASGAWLVQIAATASEASAISEWNRYSKASADLFAGAERVVQQADVNGKTVYRLRVGSFASKEDAAAFCSAFKAKGGNCYPAAK
jgi:hypothetical protein